MNDEYWIGVDLGGTKVLAALFDQNLKLLARSKQPTGAEGGPQGVFARIQQTVDAVIREAKVDPHQIHGLGFGVPGQIVPNSTIVRFAPNLEWRDLDLQPLLPADWSWPIVVENDVRMGTYGEYAFGAARGARNVFGIFAGTGVGGGLILNGELHTGFNGNGGEIGHIVVHWRRGDSLESIAGRKHMMRRAKDIIDDSPKRVRKEWKGVDLERVKSSQLAEYYQKDDPVAIQVIDDAARAIASGIASVINLLSPEVIVLGGGLAGALGDAFQERIWDIAQRRCLPGATAGIRFVPAALGDDAGVVGCAAFARSRLGMLAIAAA
jgi:glucokinase